MSGGGCLELSGGEVAVSGCVMLVVRLLAEAGPDECWPCCLGDFSRFLDKLSVSAANSEAYSDNIGV